VSDVGAAEGEVFEMKHAEDALVEDVKKSLAVMRPSPVMQDFHLLHWGTELQDFQTLFQSKVCRRIRVCKLLSSS